MTALRHSDESRVITSPQGGIDKILSVTALSLHHFRNYASAQIDLTPAPVVLTGPNGAGKTNILEALSLLTPGRGLRRAGLSEMDNRQDAQAWTVAAEVSGLQGQAQIGTGRDPESNGIERRLVKIDGKPAKSHAELAKHISMVWLTPQMEQLFNEGTSAGRKFLDRLVYGFDPEHASRINEYEFSMRERNRLLAEGKRDPAWLEALEQAMADTAAAIASARLSACEHLNHAVAASPLSFPKAQLSVHGFLEDRLKNGESAVQAEDAFKAILASGRTQDAAAGRTLTGSHRSELRVIHTEKQMPAETCSTGEQKALLLSVVLAQARSGSRWHGVVPVLLLDEVAAHLDATRKLELFQEICQIGAQVWMTGTDAGLFMDLKGKAQFLQVENGRLK